MTRGELCEQISASDYTSSAPVGRPKAAPCDEETVAAVFGGKGEMTTGEIVEVLGDNFGIMRAAANRWMTEAINLGLIEQERRGLYRKFVSKLCLETQDNSFETNNDNQYTVNPNYLKYISD